MHCLWLKTFRRTFEKLGIKRTLWVSTISHFFGYGKCRLDTQPTKFMYFLTKAISESQVSNVLCTYLPSTLNVIVPKGGQQKSQCYHG